MNNRGFTLIETILYVALLALIVGGALLAVLDLIEGAGRVSTRTSLQDEGNFVLRKINSALTGASTINVPVSGISNTLSVSRYDGIEVRIRLTGTTLEMSEDGGANYLPLTTENVSVVGLEFGRVAGTPAGVIATTTMRNVASTTPGSVDFVIKKYLRK